MVGTSRIPPDGNVNRGTCTVSESLRRGHYPDKGHGNKVAQVLRAVAADLEL